MKKDFNILNLEAIKNNDFNKLLKINSRYINTLANQYAGRDNFIFEEYQQIIRIALFKAFKNYDINNNKNFINYAKTIILNDLRSYYYKNDLLKISRQDKKDNKIQQDVVDIHSEIEDNLLLIDTIIPDVEKPIDLSSIFLAIDELRLYKENWSEIVSLHHGLNNQKPLTFTEIAPMFNMTRQGVFGQYQFAIRWLQKNKKLKFQFNLDNQ